ncbi:MAG: hypothetical protein N4A33_11950 [Bacteriovoracaceae bacterium]|jgi:HD-GYP domain-containing protein (c-di-GMP phosphodiesterase class II)|nr:hypothetical protein [Bacteriovoracaceae bacterium]
MAQINYVPIRLSTLKHEIPFSFNIYIKLPSRYLLYIKRGDSIESARINHLKEYKVRKMYIEDSDEENYQSFLDNYLSDPNASNEDKASIGTSIAYDTSEQIYESPETQEAYKAAQNTSDKLIKLLNGNDEILKAILSATQELSSQEDDLAHQMQKHSVNTCSLAIKFGEFLGLQQKELQELGIAAFYHDISFVKLSIKEQKLFFKPIDQMSPDELTLYKKHPEQDIQILQDKEFASKAVLDLIFTHEQRMDGSGFPGTSSQKLTPIQEVHALCCHYDREITIFKKEKEEVIKDFLVNEMGKFNLDTLKKFSSFLKTLQ